MSHSEPPGLRKCDRISPSTKYPKLNTQVVYFVHHVHKVSSTEKVMKPPRLLIGTANLLYQTNTANMNLYAVVPVEHIERLKVKCEPGEPDEILIVMSERSNDSDMHMQLLSAEGNEPASSAVDLCEIIRALKWRLTGKDIPIEMKVGREPLSRGAHKKKSANYQSSDKKLKQWRQQMQAPTSPFRRELLESVRSHDALRERPPFNLEDDVVYLDFGLPPWGVNVNVLTVQGVTPGSQFDKLGGRHLVGRHLIKANQVDVTNPMQLENFKSVPVQLGFSKQPLPPPNPVEEKKKKKSRKPKFESSDESEEISEEEDSDEITSRRKKKSSRRSQKDLRKASTVSHFPEVAESPKSSVAMQAGSGLVDGSDPYGGLTPYSFGSPESPHQRYGDVAPDGMTGRNAVFPNPQQVQPQKPVKINLHLNFVQCPQQDSRVEEYYSSEEEEREERRIRRAERRDRRREKKDHYKQQLQLMNAQNQLLLMQQHQQRTPSRSPSTYSDNVNNNASHLHHPMALNPFNSSPGMIPLNSPVYAPPPPPQSYNVQPAAVPQLHYLNSSQQLMNPGSANSSAMHLMKPFGSTAM